MAKFYRVLKDTPAWQKGAIIKELDQTNGDDHPNYSAISDIWDTFEDNYPPNYQEYGKIVENNPEWFERVYEVKVLNKVKYLNREKAKEAHEELYK